MYSASSGATTLKNSSKLNVRKPKNRLRFGKQVRPTHVECSTGGLFAVAERDRLDHLKDLKQRLEDAKHELEVAQRQGQFDRASQLRYSTIPELERRLPKENERLEDVESPLSMLHDRVTSSDISRVVAKATGIPVQNLLKGERDKLVQVSILVRPLVD